LIGARAFGLDRCGNDWKQNSPALGYVLRYDGSTWDADVRCISHKTHAAIQLLDDDTGFLVGASVGGDADPEFGEVSDSLLLRYKDL
jgi:hypothetical protein